MQCRYKTSEQCIFFQATVVDLWIAIEYAQKIKVLLLY